MSLTWKTKHGLRRVRVEPPTIEEAIYAAEGLTHILEEKIRIAASLMQVPVDDVRARVRHSISGTPGVRRLGGSRVVVERKALRRIGRQRG
jgi:hypothetical protein